MVHKMRTMRDARTADDVMDFLSTHKNMMTPNLVRFLHKSDKVVEVSSGRGIDNEPIYGVTVRSLARGVWADHDSEGRLFWDRKKAERYAESVM